MGRHLRFRELHPIAMQFPVHRWKTSSPPPIPRPDPVPEPDPEPQPGSDPDVVPPNEPRSRAQASHRNSSNT
jgi:hypothetical protein